jgi:hypothetical protein
MTEQTQEQGTNGQPEHESAPADGPAKQPDAPITNQIDFQKALEVRLEQERQKLAKQYTQQYADYDELRGKVTEFEQAQLTEEQKREAELEKMRTDIESHRKAAEEAIKAQTHQTLQLQVAKEKGLPTGWTTRLQGDTLEEMLADADSMLADLAKPRVPPSLDSGGGKDVREGSDITLNPQQLKIAQQHSGGVEGYKAYLKAKRKEK